MSNEFFTFPYKFEDLLEEPTDRRFFVRKQNEVQLSERLLKIKLQEISNLAIKDYTFIQDQERFDFLFFWIRSLGNKKFEFSVEFQEDTIDILTNTLERILKDAEERIFQNYNSNQEEIDEIRTCFKMTIFLLFYFLNSTSGKKGKNDFNFTEELQTKKKGNQRKAKGQNAENRDRLVAREKLALQLISEIAALDLKPLWNKRSIDYEFHKYFVQISLKMLECSEFIKDAETKLIVFQILESISVRNADAFKNIQLKLINLIYEDEGIVEPIASFVIRAYKSDKANMIKLATETLIMLVTYIMEKTNLSAESTAVKNTKEFLCKVSEVMPKLFYNNLSTFIQLYDNDLFLYLKSYLIRNALTEILANIIKQVLTNYEDEDFQNLENHTNMKKRLLDKLLKRIYDKHAFARSHTLGTLASLCKENFIPLDYIDPIFHKACDRIKDVSAMVRKRAIQLLTIAINYFFVLFVESQNKTKFLTLEEIEREMQFNKAEIDEIKKDLNNVDSMLKALGPDQVDEFDELSKEQNAMKRRLDICIQIQNKFRDYSSFVKAITSIIPNLISLLGSKNINDVIETIKLLVALNKSNILASEVGIIRMLVLIWTKEKTIKEELIRAYWQLYLNDQEFDHKTIAFNLVELLKKSTLADQTSLEELIWQIIVFLILIKPFDLIVFSQSWNQSLEDRDKDKKRNMFYISNDVWKFLWEIFIKSFQSNKEEDDEKVNTRAAIQLIRIGVAKNPELIQTRYNMFYGVLQSFIKSKKIDWFIIKELGVIIQKSTTIIPQKNANQILKLIILLLLQYQGTNDSEWYCAVESALDTTFLIQKDPQSLTEYLIKQLSKFLFPKLQVELRTQDLQYPEKLEENEDNIGSKGSQQMNIEELGGGSQGQDFENKLAQLLFVVGHVALKFLLNIDDLDLRIKQIKNEVETRKDQHKSGQNEELDQIQGGWEAQFDVILEKLHSIPENYLLSFHNENKNLLSLFIPILKKLAIDILNNKRQANNDLLSRVVVLTMSKFMCVSSQFCKENMEFLFKFLDSKFVDPVIKTNILISLGDLIHRHPNIIEPYSFHLYKKLFYFQYLRDQNPSVRKTTLMVITHLILNDMLKLKGEISDIALLFSDPDPKIQNLVKLFFHELHKKDQKLIYNLLPESIGRLSGTDGSEHQLNISEEEFKEYARNIMQYLEKDKLSEILVEKLCQRLKNSQNKKEWRNTACCLAMISQNEKSVRKLLEMFECFREKLNDNVIMDYFKQIEIKAKKISKPEWKNLVDEFETKLNNFKTATAEDRRKPVSKSQQQAIRRKNKGKMEEEKTKGVIRKGIQQMSRSRPKQYKTIQLFQRQRHQANSSDSEVSNEIVIDSDEDVQVVGSQNNRQNKQKAEKRDQNAQPQRTLRSRKPLNMMEIEGDSDGGEEDDDYGDEDN